MNFTFGVICREDAAQRIKDIHASISSQIPEQNYELLVIGNPQGLDTLLPNTRIIGFDENQKKAWITRKKNIITQQAKFENIVYMHDYLILDPKWYEGWLAFGNDFKVAMNKISNKDGTRFRDWCLWVDQPVIDTLAAVGAGTHACLIPYEEEELTRFQYFSGAYWVAKKHVMEECPLDERLCWGDGEDVEWSKVVRARYKLSMNKNSGVTITRDGKFSTFYDIGVHYKQIKDKLLGRS